MLELRTFKVEGLRLKALDLRFRAQDFGLLKVSGLRFRVPVS